MHRHPRSCLLLGGTLTPCCPCWRVPAKPVWPRARNGFHTGSRRAACKLQTEVKRNPWCSFSSSPTESAFPTTTFGRCVISSTSTFRLPIRVRRLNRRNYKSAVLTLRRHDQWLALATTPRDLRATAELQLLRQADPDSGQPLLVALDGHSVRREIWVCFDESSLDCGRRDVEQLLQIGIFRRNFHHRARFAHGIEISARRKARTGPVLVPFVVNQSRRRH